MPELARDERPRPLFFFSCSSIFFCETSTADGATNVKRMHRVSCNNTDSLEGRRRHTTRYSKKEVTVPTAASRASQGKLLLATASWLAFHTADAAGPSLTGRDESDTHGWVAYRLCKEGDGLLVVSCSLARRRKRGKMWVVGYL